MIMRKSLFPLAAALLAGVAFTTFSGARAAEEPVVIPAPALDASRAAKPGTIATAVFAGGCFWGVEGVFERVKGVISARSGYAGGAKSTAIYEVTNTGLTGHAEAVEVRYDPARITYGQLLQVFFSVAHDPTQKNRQGPDTGPQYRSALFPRDAGQEKIARAYIAQLGKAGAWRAPIVTTLEGAKPFYPAENYHQDFLRRNPTYPYIVLNDLPKVAALKRLFPTLYGAPSA